MSSLIISDVVEFSSVIYFLCVRIPSVYYNVIKYDVIVRQEISFIIGRFINISNKSTKTSIQIQLYTIAKKEKKKKK